MNENLRYLHIRPRSISDFSVFAPKGGITLAYTAPARAGDKMIWVSLAVCSKNDTYSRKLGVKLATERFLSGEGIMIATRKGESLASQLAKAFHPVMELAVPYDNEEQQRNGRMQQKRTKQGQRKQQNVQAEQQAGDQQISE